MSPADHRLPTVTVCRGCCCGTDKHPDVDHEAHLTALRTRLAGAARIRVSDCLDACARSNVVVVQPSPAGRAAGGRCAWLGHVLDATVVDRIADWVGAGGPGVAPTPPALFAHAGPPPPGDPPPADPAPGDPTPGDPTPWDRAPAAPAPGGGS